MESIATHAKNTSHTLKGEKTRISTKIHDDVDYSQEDKKKPLCFKTVHKYSYFIPSEESCTSETHKLLVQTLVDDVKKDSLEKSGVINWCKHCTRLLPLKVPEWSCDFLDVISLLMWGIPDSQLFLRGILYLTACNDYNGDFKKTFYRHINTSSDEEGIGQQAQNENVWNRFKKFIKHGGASMEEEEYFLSMAIYMLTNNLKRPIIVLTESQANRGSIGGVYLPVERNPAECFKNPLVMAYHGKTFVPLVIEEAAGSKNSIILMTCSASFPGDARYSLKMNSEIAASCLPVCFVHESRHNSDLLVQYFDILSDAKNNLYAKYHSAPSFESWNPVYSTMRMYNKQTSQNTQPLVRSQSTHVDEKDFRSTVLKKKPLSSTEPMCRLKCVGSMNSALFDNPSECQHVDTLWAEPLLNENQQTSFDIQLVSRNGGVMEYLPSELYTTKKNELTVQHHRDRNPNDVYPFDHVEDGFLVCKQNLSGHNHRRNVDANCTDCHHVSDRLLTDPLHGRRNTEAKVAKTRLPRHELLLNANHMFNNNKRQHCDLVGLIPGRKCITDRCEMYGLPETGGMCSQCLKNYTLRNNVKTRPNNLNSKTRPSNLNQYTFYPELNTAISDMSLMGEKCSTFNCRYNCSVNTYPFCYECLCKH